MNYFKIIRQFLLIILHCVILSRSIDKFDSEPIATHDLSHIKSLQLSPILPFVSNSPMNGLTPSILKNIPSELKSAVFSRNQVVGDALSNVNNMGASFPLESAAKPIFKAAPVALPGIPDKQQSKTLPGIPKKKPSDDLPDPKKKNSSKGNDDFFRNFTLEIASNKGISGSESWSVPPSGISFVLNTPLGFDSGKNKFNLSFISSSYTYFKESSYSYWDYFEFSYEDTIESSFTGVGGKLILSDLALLEGYIGSWNSGDGEAEKSTTSSAYNVFAGISSSFLTGRKNYLLIGPELFYIADLGGGTPSGWMAINIRLSLGLDQVLALTELLSKKE